MQKSSAEEFEKRSGFTLIEILVVIAIIGILTGTAVLNFGKNDDRDLKMDVDQFIAIARTAQNKALTGEKDANNPDRHICGYGVHNQGGSQWVLYYSYITDPSTESCKDQNKFMDGCSCQYENYYPLHGTAMGEANDIYFALPNADVYNPTSDDPNQKLSTDTILQFTKGSSSRSVRITPGGIIDEI